MYDVRTRRTINRNFRRKPTVENFAFRKLQRGKRGRGRDAPCGKDPLQVFNREKRPKGLVAVAVYNSQSVAAAGVSHEMFQLINPLPFLRGSTHTHSYTTGFLIYLCSSFDLHRVRARSPPLRATAQSSSSAAADHFF